MVLASNFSFRLIFCPFTTKTFPFYQALNLYPSLIDNMIVGDDQVQRNSEMASFDDANLVGSRIGQRERYLAQIDTMINMPSGEPSQP